MRLTPQTRVALILAVATSSTGARARAECTPQWLPPDGQSGLNQRVNALATWDPDDTGPESPLLVAGGYFTLAGGAAANRIAAWDGMQWHALGDGVSGGVLALAVYNGELIAGGEFLNAGGVIVHRIAAWDGATWRALGSGIDDPAWPSYVPLVQALAVYDGLLAVSGAFESVSGVDARYTAAWNGTEWYALGAGLATADSIPVKSFTVYRGELIAAGSFFAVGGVAANNVAAWNRTEWRSLGSGTNGSVRTLTVYDGELVAGGTFATTGGVSASGIAVWDGTQWRALDTGISGTVRATAVYDGELIAAGGFASAGGVNVNNIARWDGAQWRALGAGTGSSVLALTSYFSDLVAGGSFTVAGDEAAAYWARWGLTSSYPAGDLDCSNTVDLLDHALLAECLLGPGTPHPPGCLRADLDGDDDVDLGDFAAFQEAFAAVP